MGIILDTLFPKTMKLNTLSMKVDDLEDRITELEHDRAELVVANNESVNRIVDLEANKAIPCEGCGCLIHKKLYNLTGEVVAYRDKSLGCLYSTRESYVRKVYKCGACRDDEALMETARKAAKDAMALENSRKMEQSLFITGIGGPIDDECDN